MIWTRQGDALVAAVAVHTAWHGTAEAYVAHRARVLRAKPRGFLQPCEVQLGSDSLVLRFAPGLLGRPPAAPQGAHAWDAVAQPLLDRMLSCHAERHAGLGPLVGTDWTPPVSWFLPASDAPDFEARRREDLALADQWLQRCERVPRELRPALREGDHAKLVRLLTSERHLAQLRAVTEPPPPSFLTLLTEAELLERIGTL